MFTDLSDPVEANTALHALAAAGVRVEDVDKLLTRMDVAPSKSEFDRSQWLMQLGNTIATAGRAVVPRLIEALKSGDSDVRTTAICACRRLGPIAADAALPLADLYSRRDRPEKDYQEPGYILYALQQMGSSALPAVDKLIAVFDSASFVAAMIPRYTAAWDPVPILNVNPSQTLAEFGPAVAPKLYRGLSGEKPTMRAGCAETLAKMTAEEAPDAVAQLFAQFDRETDETVQVYLVRALVALDADEAELRRRLEPFRGEIPDLFDRKPGSLMKRTATVMLDAMADGGPKPKPGFGELTWNYGRKFYADLPPELFQWGKPVAGLQIGVYLQPIKYDTQRSDPDLQRILLAVRNVGDRPVWLPTDGRKLIDAEFVFPQRPEVTLWRYGRQVDRCEVTELRPGQVIIQGLLSLDRNFGHFDQRGRWIKFEPEDRPYRVAVKLSAIDRLDALQRQYRVPAALRSECWKGEIVSGEIEAHFDGVAQRESRKAAAEQK